MATYTVVNGTELEIGSVGVNATLDNDGQQGANAAHIFTAVKKGVQGNAITIRFFDDVSNPSPPTVSVSGTAITVNVDAGVTIASAVKTAIDGNENAARLVTLANKGGNDGTGVVSAFGPTALSGGTADYLLPNQMKVVELTDAQAVAFVVAGAGLVKAGASRQEMREIARKLKYQEVSAQA